MGAMRLVGALVVLAACGAPEAQPITTEMVIPWSGHLACSERELVGERMRATLRIGGFTDCELSVNPDTLEATGLCPEIWTGSKRPLLLTYEQRDIDGLTLPVGFWIGLANLCEDNLPQAGSELQVDFVNDNVTGALIFEQADIDSLPDGELPLPSCQDTLVAAKMWAKQEIVDMGRTLDYDCDTQSNIVEACGDTLFTQDLSLCN